MLVPRVQSGGYDLKTDETEVTGVQSACQSAIHELPQDPAPTTAATVFNIDTKLNDAATQLISLVSQLAAALAIDKDKLGAIHAAIVAKDAELARVFR